MMKWIRGLLAVMILDMMTVSASAAGLSSMVFDCADGSRHSIASENLTISIRNGLLTASNGVEQLELEAATVTRFFFGEGSGVEASGISDNGVEVFNMEGERVGRFESMAGSFSSLRPGVYVVKADGGSYKIRVK